MKKGKRFRVISKNMTILARRVLGITMAIVIGKERGKKERNDLDWRRYTGGRGTRIEGHR